MAEKNHEDDGYTTPDNEPEVLDQIRANAQKTPHPKLYGQEGPPPGYDQTPKTGNTQENWGTGKVSPDGRVVTDDGKLLNKRFLPKTVPDFRALTITENNPSSSENQNKSVEDDEKDKKN